jgi:hypothetical protein
VSGDRLNIGSHAGSRRRIKACDGEYNWRCFSHDFPVQALAKSEKEIAGLNNLLPKTMAINNL